MSSRGPAIFYGGLNLLSGALVGLGVFAGLPERYAPIDGFASLLIVLLLGSGVGLLAEAAWAPKAAVVAASVSLLLGLVLFALLALSASYLWGIYGPVGRGGAVIFALVAALALPYLVVLPAVELRWLRQSKSKSGGRIAG